jgi:hypothetical protein
MKHQDNTLNLIFSIVDDFCKRHIKKKRKKRGRKYRYSDNQILKMVAIKSIASISSDRSLICFLSDGLGRKIFPGVPDHSRFNRRSKELMPILVKFQRFLVKKMNANQNLIRIIDSTPVPVKSYWRSGRSDTFPEGNYGYCAAKREKYFGFKLHLLITPQGVPTNFDLSPANIHDGKMIEELIENYEHLIILADMGYLDREKQMLLKTQNKILITPYRKNQKQKNSQFEQRLLKFRRKIETVFSQLKDQMNLAKTRAKSILGLAVRVISIITSFTLAIYINSLKGRRLLKIKSLLI